MVCSLQNERGIQQLSERDPVRIRNRVVDTYDPYVVDEALEDNTVCKSCSAIYSSGRWYTNDAPQHRHAEDKERHETTCPACRKFADHMPGGVVKITGEFIDTHRDEILNLIKNESNNALRDNPLERIMSMGTEHGETEITTTNEKLAQRIGRALHKAYGGDIEYKWSGDNKLARVNWHRA